MSKKNTIKKYCNYYIWASSLCPWGTNSDVIIDGEVGVTTLKYNELGVNTKKELYDSCDSEDMLIEVRYLGHGEFREVLTNESILAINDNGNNFEDKNYFNENNEKFIRSTLYDLDEYIKFNDLAFGKYVDVHSFGKSISDFMLTAHRTALVINPDFNVIHIKKESKQAYEEKSDDERIELIKKMLKKAEKERAKVYAKLMYAYGMSFEPSKEFIDAAYRENEKRSLALKPKQTKKDSK
ncbi:MAG: hypothetical protein J5892_03005 [Bacilli bacterium]|nr:hypothetical protein [Bacilli bacterium]